MAQARRGMLMSLQMQRNEILRSRERTDRCICADGYTKLHTRGTVLRKACIHSRALRGLPYDTLLVPISNSHIRSGLGARHLALGYLQAITASDLGIVNVMGIPMLWVQVYRNT
jgi:hypothetical protein